MRAALTALFILSLSPTALASPPTLHQIQYGEREGLLIRSPREVVIGDDGMVWMASHDGLIRFDGHTFDTFKSHKDGLPTSRLLGIQKHTDGVISAYTDGGHIVLVSPEGFEIVGGGKESGFRGYWYEDKGEVVWLWRTSEVLKYTRGGGIERRFEIPNLAWNHAGRTTWGDFFFVVNETIHRFPPTGEARPIHLPSPADVRFHATFDGPNGELLVSTEKQLYVLDKKGLSPHPSASDTKIGAICAGFTLEGGDLIMRNNEAWWRIGDRVERLMDIAPQAHCNARLVIWEGEPVYAEGSRLMSGKEVLADVGARINFVAVSPLGDIWVTVDRGGLIRLRRPEIKTLAEGEGLPKGGIFTLMMDREDVLWVGVWGQGIARWAKPMGGLRPEIFPAALPEHKAFATVSALYQDERGQLWGGNWNGLTRFEGGVFSNLDVTPGSETEPSAVRFIHEDGQGRAWMGKDDGLWVGDLEKQTWSKLREDAGLPGKARIYSILETRSGDLYAGTAQKGVFMKRRGSEHFEQIGLGGALATSHARTLSEGRAGDIWAGTEARGLCRIRPGAQAPQVACVDKVDGLVDQGVHCVHEDSKGRVWTSSNRGISWLLGEELHRALDGGSGGLSPVSFDTRDGMKNAECNGGFQNPCVTDKAGRLYLATQEGLAVVETDEIPLPEPPMPMLTELRVGNGPPIAFPVHRARKIDLKAEERRLEVAWSAPSLYRGEDLKFRYRLKGSDEGWLGPTERRRAMWTNLPPGRFELEAQTGLGGRWSKPATLATITRIPTFAETGWFIALMALLVALGMGVGVWFYTLNLRKRRDELAELVRVRTQTIEERNDQLESRAHQLSDQNMTLSKQKNMLTERSRQLSEQAERLAELDEIKNRFVASVSHELRTPLTLVQGVVSDLLSKDNLLDDKAKDRIEMAQRNAKRLGELVEQLLEVARLEAGAVPLKVRKLDLGTFIRRVTSRFEHSAQDKRIDLSVNTTDRPVSVFFSPDMMDKVITNLVGNAIKFTPAQGAISLSLEVEGDEEEGLVRVSVSDTGIGIAPEHRDELFERFFQVDSEDSRSFEGTGLGLAISKEFVELHGGQIGVKEGPEGVGSCFFFTLPLGVAHISPEDIDLQPSEQDAVVTEAVEGQQGVGHVLVVEDHPDMRAFIVEHLSALYQVSQAQNGADALKAIEEDKPDLVISDIMMPQMDGMEMARRLRAGEETRDVPILLVSAKGTNQARLESLALADDFLGKPFLMPELLSRVALLLQKRARTLQHDVEGEETKATGDKKSDIGLSEADQVLLSKLNEVLETRLSFDDFGVETLGEALGLSRRVLYRTTRRLLQQTPANIIRERRLQRAQTLLEEGTFSTVAEVAAAVGMTPSYFATLFKSRFGATPKQRLRK